MIFWALIASALGLQTGEREEYMPRVIFESIAIHMPKDGIGQKHTERNKTVVLQSRVYFGCWQEERFKVRSFPVIRRRDHYQILTVLDGDRVRRIRTRSVYHKARTYRAAGMGGIE